MDLRGPSKPPAYFNDGPQTSPTTEVDASSQEHEINPMLQTGVRSPSDTAKHEPYSKAPGYRTRRFDLTWKWKWELLSLVGTTMSLVAIVIVLNHYDGQPSPKWPYEITLNTLVSVFSTLLKALMMMAVAECISQLKWIWFKDPRSLMDLTTFENASRGPWGSAQLLFTLKFHHLAALGALVTIVTIAVDPFVQQAIRFYSCTFIETNSLASIPIAQSYAPQQDLLSPLEVAMVGAIYDGLLNPSFNGSFVSSKCPTGNCTFPIKYTTFGVCSSCTNLAYDINNEFIDVVYNASTWNATSLAYDYSPAPRILLNSTLPSSDDPTRINAWDAITMLQPPFNESIQLPPTLILGPTGQLPNFTRFPESTPYQDKGYFLAGFTSLSYTRSSSCTSEWMTGGDRKPDTDCVVPALVPGAKEKVTTCQTSPMDNDTCVTLEDFDSVTASACGLSFCGRTYEGVVHEGSFNETLISESNATEIATPFTPSHNTKLPSNDTYPSYMLSPCWYNNTEYENVYDYLGFNMTAALWNHASLHQDDIAAALATGKGPLNYTYMTSAVADDAHKKAVFDGCVVDSHFLAAINLREFLQKMLNGSVTGMFMARGASDGRPNPGKDWATMANKYTAEFLNPMYADGLATHGTTQALFEKLAVAMTNHMRTSDRNSSAVVGEVNGVQTCVRVVWPWLALPAVLVLATCLLLIATIWKTAVQAGANVWKSSPLAYLFHGLEVGERGSLITVDEMEGVARGREVVLSETGLGWRFVDGGRDRMS
ncbi:hypothetical protein BKA64DRAFT_747158 [Cadophora sp. MPI-SDFR-AT-0126]|nr:hypothetical protein BKA64DRAFT_747158 [Leotiomycetes sp. MPI-SDFR-AT-0126]